MFNLAKWQSSPQMHSAGCPNVVEILYGSEFTCTIGPHWAPLTARKAANNRLENFCPSDNSVITIVKNKNVDFVNCDTSRCWALMTTSKKKKDALYLGYKYLNVWQYQEGHLSLKKYCRAHTLASPSYESMSEGRCCSGFTHMCVTFQNMMRRAGWTSFSQMPNCIIISQKNAHVFPRTFMQRRTASLCNRKLQVMKRFRPFDLSQSVIEWRARSMNDTVRRDLKEQFDLFCVTKTVI